MSMKMCPHCGRLFARIRKDGLIPKHAHLGGAVRCAGSEQGPWNPASDRRDLWNGQKSPLEREGGAR